jgi:chromosome segregation ATPase
VRVKKGEVPSGNGSTFRLLRFSAFFLKVAKVSTKVSEKIAVLQKNLTELKSNLTGGEDALQKATTRLNLLKTTHDSLMFDSRSLLKVMSKTQEPIGLKAQDYLAKQKAYLNDITELCDSINSINAIDKKSVVSNLVAKLESDSISVYDDLMRYDFFD